MATEISRDMKIGIVIGMMLVAEVKPHIDPAIRSLMRAWDFTNADVVRDYVRREVESIFAQAIMDKTPEKGPVQ